jgi:hypothetical protein
LISLFDFLCIAHKFHSIDDKGLVADKLGAQAARLSSVKIGLAGRGAQDRILHEAELHEVTTYGGT